MTIAGQLDRWPYATRHYEPWSGQEDGDLAELVEHGWALQRMARRLQRRPGAVRSRMHDLGLRWTCAGRYTLSRVARLMGVDIHAVAWWRDQGWLRATRAGARMGRYHLWLVDHEDLCCFLEDERYWAFWEPDRITDAALREWTQELRQGVRFLTTAQAGEVLCLTHGGVNVAIREGRLPAVKRGANWLVRSDQLRLPEERLRTKGPPFLPEDLDYIRRHWGTQPATQIAKALGRRSDTGVLQAARRLGLPPVGRGYWRKVGDARKRSKPL